MTTSETITYHERQEPGFLERILLDRRYSALNALLFFCAAISVALAIFHLFAAVFGTPEGRSFRSVHLTVMLVLAVLMNPLCRVTMRDPILVPGDPKNGVRALGFGIDLFLVASVIIVQVWTIWDVGAFQMRMGEKTPGDLLMGAILIFMVFEGTRRAVGWAMVFITGFFMLHALFADHFFGFFYGPPVSWSKFIDVLFMSSDGIFGIPLHVCATYIVLFIIFGAVLIRSGAGRFFIDLAVSLTGHKTGGPAKAAAVASGFMGTVSGSAVANVVTTGSFTIPLMKKVGYRAKFAAAVEACASSGGQITPPIMGAAAFIMAEFLAVPYTTIIIAAIIPALLYFATIYFMVHLEAEKRGIASIPKNMLPQTREVLRRGWHLLIALAILIAFLLYGFTPMKSAFYGLAAIVGLSFVNPATRMSPVDLFAALEAGVRASIPVSIACACAGIIIGSVFVSGLGLKFTQSAIELADGNLLILLGLTGVASIILGMGITTTAVYITVAALIVPALIKMGVEPIAAHMFAFYYGVVSSITPPVALAAFAGAAIAKTPPMATAVEATRVGVAKYIAPLIFVYNPSLLFVGPLWLTAVSAVLALIGLWVLTMALEGWFEGAVDPLRRIGLLAAATLLLYPPVPPFLGVAGWWATLAGAALAALCVGPRIAARRLAGRAVR
ncbi:TRAP transporter permease [Pikeienuella piscinae]|uniref:TRAP transporter permease n=1 Tax=Pikeienuella piscinae TaxID=2748098 RepID=A0A7L5C2L8_9RHOB|nr:TRAP transporter permease [Pikeienuella piscinae]QIE56796.1 TRAP transporter permease [Pikeienuella piscinae]